LRVRGEIIDRQSRLLERLAPGAQQAKRVLGLQILGRSGARSVKRQIDGEVRDSRANECFAHRVRHALLSGTKTVEQQGGWRAVGTVRSEQDSRHSIRSVDDLEVIPNASRHIARRLDHG